MYPDITVIIPTTGKRSMYLMEAIKSCFRASPNHRLEIIVVFNGCNLEDAVLPEGVSDLRIKCTWIDARGANLARNHGLAVASGSYCMFLDDDDWLHDEKLSEVLIFINEKKLDVCSCACDIVENGSVREILSQPTTGDLIENVLAFRLMPWPLAHVHRRVCLPFNPWVEDIDAAHDQVFFLTLCEGTEVRWAAHDTVLGSYRCHTEEKQSVIEGKLGNRLGLYRLERLMRLFHVLVKENRVSPERFMAARDGLVLCTHQIFVSYPVTCLKAMLTVLVEEVKKERKGAIYFWGRRALIECALYLPRVVRLIARK